MFKSALLFLFVLDNFHNPDTRMEKEACRGAQLVLINKHNPHYSPQSCSVREISDSGRNGKIFSVVVEIRKGSHTPWDAYLIEVPCEECAYGIVAEDTDTKHFLEKQRKNLLIE